MKLAMLLIFILAPATFAHQRITSASIQEFSALVKKKSLSIPPEKILVVYDFDNTLMAMKRDLGSDQWYHWQAGLIKAGKKSNDAVAADMSGLFDIHAKIFSLGSMRFVEPHTVSIVKELQKLNFKALVLTSRGPGLRGDVEEELASENLSFRELAPGPPGGLGGNFLLENQTRKISFSDGIVMGSGQHKGQILQALLKKLNADFKVIVFIDDTLKNIENMEESYQSESPELISFYYTAEQERVRKFEKDQSQAKNDWRILAPVLKSLAGG